jgi:hypothetical protein
MEGGKDRDRQTDRHTSTYCPHPRIRLSFFSCSCPNTQRFYAWHVHIHHTYPIQTRQLVHVCTNPHVFGLAAVTELAVSIFVAQRISPRHTHFTGKISPFRQVLAGASTGDTGLSRVRVRLRCERCDIGHPEDIQGECSWAKCCYRCW